MTKDFKDYGQKALTDGKCPDCGSQDLVELYRNHKNVQPVPEDNKGKCVNCQYYGNPGEFKFEKKKEKMSDDDLAVLMRQFEKYEFERAEAEYAASALAQERESSSGGYSQ